jgi:hypothetical protein
MYLDQFKALQRSVELMEDEDRGRAAVLEAAKDRADDRYTRLAWVVGVVSVLSMLVSVGVAFAAVVN